MIATLQRLYKISRPRFWMYSFGPLLIWLIAGYIYTGVVPSDMLYIYIGMVVIYTLIWSNIIIYGVNDLADEDTDALNNKKDAYEHRLHASERHGLVKSIQLCIFLGLVVLLWWWYSVYGDVDMYILLWAYVLFLFTGIWYSIEPIRAKSKPFIDGIFNLLYIVPSIRWWMIITWGWEGYNLYALFAWWLWAMAMHAYSAIPDIEPDQQAELQTTAVVLWYRWTLSYCLGLRSLAAAIAVRQFGSTYIFLLVPYIVMIALSRRGQIMRRYRLFPWINGVVGFCLFWMIVLL